MKVRDSIERKLKEALEPTVLTVLDQSAEHAGHMGHHGHGDGETHFHVEVVSRAFVGKSKVERNRMVYALLAEEIAGGVHALSMSTQTPEEV
jgi:BolA protein